MNEVIQPATYFPIQDNRLKREARRLSDWTGLALSESQEITARAFGHTSWQALLKRPSFVPDEQLDGYPHVLADHEKRYTDIGRLLGSRLNISEAQGLFLATLWQPTALQPSPAVWMWSTNKSEIKDWRIIHLLEKPQIRDGVFNIALASRYVFDKGSGVFGKTEHALLAIHRDRSARFVADDDVTHLQVSSAVEELIALDWNVPFTDVPMKKRLAKLVKEVGRPGAIDLSSLPSSIASSPVRLKASWLLRPVDEGHLISTFAKHQPWRPEDYPGIKKSERGAFWAKAFSGFSVHSFFAADTIFFNVYTPQRAGYPHSEVQAGVGGLRYLNRTEGPFSVSEPGYYLVKYGNQPRGYSPIPGMDETLAAQVRTDTGLSGSFDDTPMDFFCSEAGLALAKWAATFPRRASNVGVGNSYTGVWYDSVKLRMEFELARSGALD